MRNGGVQHPMHMKKDDRRSFLRLDAPSGQTWLLGVLRPRILRSGGVLLCLALIMTGCSAIEKDRRAVGLQAATHGYESAVRWGYLENAFGFLHPDLREGQTLPVNMGGLRVTSYDVIQPPVIQPDGSATQIVIIDYLFEDTQVVKRLTDRQIWRWDETGGGWWLHSGLPQFGPEGPSS